MKKLFFLSTLFLGIALFSACNKDDDNTTKEPGTLEINFDNVAVVNDSHTQLSMVTPGSTTYQYTNALGQKFNINLLRYFISGIELDGPNGEHFHDQMEVTAVASKGYYLVDEALPASQRVLLENVPAGQYNKITFTLGVDSTGVTEGAAGGALDAATNQMFWNWNSGYIAVKFEGQSDMSNGGAGGETINGIANGMAYHIGGWKDIPGTAFVYNNKRLSFTFDTNVRVEKGEQPEVHMIFDILKMFSGHHNVDFTGNHNVHKPEDGEHIGHNLEDAFSFDHIHQ